MQEPDQIQAVTARSLAGARRAPGGENDKVMIPRRCSVAEYSFAAHVDGVENREFIEEVGAPVVVSEERTRDGLPCQTASNVTPG